LAALLALGAGAVHAQSDFPNKPIELVVPFQPAAAPTRWRVPSPMPAASTCRKA
jgi:hypothetical protein